MSAPAEVIAKRLPPGIGLVEPIDEERCFLEIGSSTFESLAMHIALLGVDFEVTEPAELVNQVRQLAERYRRAISRLPPESPPRPR